MNQEERSPFLKIIINILGHNEQLVSTPKPRRRKLRQRGGLTADSVHSTSTGVKTATGRGFHCGPPRRCPIEGTPGGTQGRSGLRVII